MIFRKYILKVVREPDCHWLHVRGADNVSSRQGIKYKVLAPSSSWVPCVLLDEINHGYENRLYAQLQVASCLLCPTVSHTIVLCCSCRKKRWPDSCKRLRKNNIRGLTDTAMVPSTTFATSVYACLRRMNLRNFARITTAGSCPGCLHAMAMALFLTHKSHILRLSLLHQLNEAAVNTEKESSSKVESIGFVTIPPISAFPLTQNDNTRFWWTKAHCK